MLCQEKPLYTYRYTGFGERTTWEIKHNEHTLWSIKQDLANYIYGAIQEATTDISPWHFASKRSLSRANLTSFGRRDYDASLGRWLIPDPQGFDDGINLYAYVHNSPITGYDAWGLDCRGFDYSSWDVIRDRGLNRLSEHALCASVATRTVFNDFANIGIAATNRFNNKWGTGPQFNYINTDFSSWRQSFNTTFNTNRFNTVGDSYLASAQNVGHFATESIITGAAMGAAFRTASAMNSVGKSLSLAYTGAAEGGLLAAGSEAFSAGVNVASKGAKNMSSTSYKATFTNKVASTAKNAAVKVSRAKNKLQPCRQAGGPHSTFQFGNSGRIEKYATWEYNPFYKGFVETKRFRGLGKPHGGVQPPIVLTPKQGKGLGGSSHFARKPEPWELPLGH